MCHWSPRRRRKGGKDFKRTIINNEWLKTSPKLAGDTGIQIQEVQWIQQRINLKKTTPRHSRVKLPKNKDKGEKVLKAAREKQHLM